MKKLIILLLFMFSTAQADDVVIVLGQSNARALVTNANIQAHFDERIINCGHNGASITALKPSWNSGTMFGNCVAQVKNNKVKGIIFWQGETDAKSFRTAMAWPDKTMGVLQALRNIYGMTVPIIMVLLNDSKHTDAWGCYWENIRYFQQRMVAPYLYKIDSSPYEWAVLPEAPNDKIHLTDEGWEAISVDIASLFTSLGY